MARGVSQIDAANVAELYALASQVLAGSKLFRGGPETIGNSGLESLLDGHWPRESGTSTAQSTKVPSAVTQPADASLADIKFINPLDMLEDGRTRGRYGPRDLRYTSKRRATIWSLPPSRIGRRWWFQIAGYGALLKSSSWNTQWLTYRWSNFGFRVVILTVSAFQTLVSRWALNEQEMQALHTMAEAIDSAIIDTVWLWNGGDAANDVLREMIEPAERGTLTDIKPPEKGVLQFTCVKATGLLAKTGCWARATHFALCGSRVTPGSPRLFQEPRS